LLIEWLPALACVSLIIYLLLQRSSAAGDDSAARLALFVGVRRLWGESDASLRRRSLALSRWPHEQEAPDFVWWARLCRRIWKPRER
jgi:hypothetical protein